MLFALRRLPIGSWPGQKRSAICRLMSVTRVRPGVVRRVEKATTNERDAHCLEVVVGDDAISRSVAAISLPFDLDETGRARSEREVVRRADSDDAGNRSERGAATRRRSERHDDRDTSPAEARARAATAFAGAKPMSRASTTRKLRIRSPAPTSRTIASASSRADQHIARQHAASSSGGATAARDGLVQCSRDQPGTPARVRPAPHAD